MNTQHLSIQSPNARLAEGLGTGAGVGILAMAGSAAGILWFGDYHVTSHNVFALLKDMAGWQLVRLSNLSPLVQDVLEVFSISVSLAAGVWAGWMASRPVDMTRRLRGFRLLRGREAIDAAKSPGADGIRLTPQIQISHDRTTKHFFIAGGTGSGKSVQITHIINEATRQNARKIILNYKGLTEKLPGGVTIICPSDARSVAWSISEDCSTTWEAAEMADRLIRGKEDFFTLAARQILTAIICACQEEKGPGGWGFQDLAAGFLLPAEELKKLCQQYYPIAARQLEDPTAKSTTDTLKTVASVAGPVFAMAAAWGNRQEFSLRDWLKNPDAPQRTLVWQIDDNFSSLSAAINQSLLNVIRNTLSSLPDVPADDTSRRVFIVADEFPQLGKIEGWGKALEVSRSKGFCICTVAQTESQLIEIYGKESANAWLSMVGTKILGRNDGESAAWYSKLCGEVEEMVPTETISTGPGGRSISSGWQRQTRQVLFPSQATSELGLVDSHGEITGDGAAAVGCRMIYLGFGDVLLVDVPFLKLPKLRPDFIQAEWTLPTIKSVAQVESLDNLDQAERKEVGKKVEAEFNQQVAEMIEAEFAEQDEFTDPAILMPAPVIADIDPENDMGGQMAEKVAGQIIENAIGIDLSLIEDAIDLAGESERVAAPIDPEAAHQTIAKSTESKQRQKKNRFGVER